MLQSEPRAFWPRTIGVRRRALVTVSTVAVWTGAGLWAESRVGLTGQLLLGGLTVCVLAGLLPLQAPAVRAQALLVAAVATVGEVVGSLLWGVYEYRFDNLPLFVPPGHALVYLGGVAIARSVGRRSMGLVTAAAAAVLAWGALGLSTLTALDVSGAIGCAVLAAVLLTTRQPVYAGVFFVVAALELYGTALGTWTWQAAVPGLGIPQGNPPSGVASGYVLFDVVALTVAARFGLLRQRMRVDAELEPVSPPASGSAAA